MSTNTLTHRCECGAEFRYPPELAGRSGACKKCGARVTLPQPSEPQATPQPEQQADEYALEVAEIKPPRINFADAYEPEAPAPLSASAAAVSSGFWIDAFRGFLFWKDPDSAIKLFCMALAISVFSVLAPFTGCLGLIVGLGMYGWIAGYCFNVIMYASSESDDLPDPFEFDGIHDSVIVPIAKVLVVTLALMIPSVIVGLITDNPIVRLGALGLSYFLWPGVMLIAALGGVLTALRLDIVARTIASALLPYLAIWFMLLVGIGAMSLAGVAGLAGTAGSAIDLGHPWVPLVLGNLTGVASLVITMRTIGLYYRHFNEHFPWSAG